MTTNDSDLLDLANELFVYDGEFLRWKIRKARRIQIGDIAGAEHPDGHRYVTFNASTTGVHRIIYLIVHGYFPHKVDHADGNGMNNRIGNLRAASSHQNMHNVKLRSDNTSGAKGVTWREAKNVWVVRVQANQKRIYVGSFKDLELAELVAIEARNKFHGCFARHK